jgi:predicted dehydrogenase
LVPPGSRTSPSSGKHVLSEKPFAGNADEARVVRAAAAAAQVIVNEAAR